MAIAKVILNGVTQMNVTDTTATADDVAAGKVFYSASGARTIGTASGGGGGSDAVVKAIIDRSIQSITLPEDLSSIGSYAFYNCTSLTSVILPDGVSSIGVNAFYNCTSLSQINLPDSLTAIYGYAFYQCRNLSLSGLPGGITSIGTYAFYTCRSITISALPESLTSLGAYTFGGCSEITTLDVPSGVSSIPANCFNGCTQLQTLILRKSNAICALANISAFTNTPIRGYNGLSGTIYVPSALISTYQTATNWSTIYGNGHVTFAAIEGSEYEL